MQDPSLLFSRIPLWGIFIFTLLLVLVSIEGGYQWARRKKRSEVEKEAPVGAMVGAMLGFLAFLLGFMFNMAAERYHDRKIALLDEANAIRSTYLQAGMISEPHRGEVRKILRSYVEERLQWAGAEKIKAERASNDSLGQLWAQASLVGAQNPGGFDVFLGSVNQVINLHAARSMLREKSQIPGAFCLALYLLTLLALATMGYHGGVAGTNRSPVTLAAAIAFSVFIMLVADIDRPGKGFVNVSQQPMMDLKYWMEKSQS